MNDEPIARPTPPDPTPAASPAHTPAAGLAGTPWS